MTAKKKNKVELKKLYWKTDREKIEEILKSLNPKYLLGRLEYHDPWKKRNYAKEEEEREAGKKYTVTINYNGYTFECSKRTLTKECERRAFEENTMEAIPDYRLWNSRSRFHRFLSVSKKDDYLRGPKGVIKIKGY